MREERRGEKDENERREKDGKREMRGGSEGQKGAGRR